MADSQTKNDDSSLPFLLCQEDNSCFTDQELDQEPRDRPWCFVSKDEEYYVENLFRREIFFGFGSDSGELCSPATQSWLKSARSEAVLWVFNTRELFRFNLRTAYLSITFFDRFLSKRRIDNGKVWAMRLLAVACLSLAAKIEECNVPVLSEFPVRDFDFESKVIQRMELLILTTLEWKMGSMTPFSYLDYVINKLCPEDYDDRSSNGLVTSVAVELILAMARETNLVDSRPLIVAACAVLVASGGRLAREAIQVRMNVIKFLTPQDMENVYSCYNLLQEIEKRKIKTPTTTTQQFSASPNVVLSTRKRRLTFTESDHSNPVKKLKY